MCASINYCILKLGMIVGHAPRKFLEASCSFRHVVEEYLVKKLEEGRTEVPCVHTITNRKKVVVKTRNMLYMKCGYSI